MTENEPLLKAVLTNPDDDDLRLKYALWCDSSTDESVRLRGEFIRLEIELVRASYSPQRPPVTAWNRQERLLQQYRVSWSGGLAARVEDFSFHRGFVEWIRLPAAAFLEHAREYFAMAPVRHVDLTAAKELIPQITDSPCLNSLRSLAIEGQGLGDAEARLLAESPWVTNLRWLSLSNNLIDRKGVEEFYRTAALPKLRMLGLKGNPCDPRERYGCDDNLITVSWMTDEGKSLEAIYGSKRWLHGVGSTVGDWFPSRFLID